ncbi:FtsQ-type POTRA domain-containing protein [Domibacillus sp. A3M-37]|uniref:cell division protein FtsQ/DivIB n=1 Tax=Domibacillus TaxID=1433999 RepID=UPI0020B658A4|nr:FtsQ-type POTRA domain-containing protein [Domibacillus sp. A3M-37]MCP3761912.1 FtsQ-type POTRA domain-containing protein [Domibacillus sp. A3M-37]
MTKQKVISIEDRIPKLKQIRKKKANRRLLLLLSVFFSLILLVVYLQSPLSKVAEIHVQGSSLMTKQEIIEQSGLETGASIWTAGKGRAEEALLKDDRIKEASVTAGFPNDLMIAVVEQNEIAYAARKGGLYPVLQNGKILSEPVSGAPLQLPILYDFKEGEALDLFAEAAQTLPNEVFNTISEVYYDPKKNDSLHIKAFMTDGFEVSATLSTFAEKMVYYPSISTQLNPDVKGVIDIEVGSYFKAYDPAQQQETGEEAVEEAEMP